MVKVQIKIRWTTPKSKGFKMFGILPENWKKWRRSHDQILSSTNTYLPMRASILSWISYHRTQSLLYNSFWKGFSGNGCYCDWLKARVKGFSLFPDCLRVLRLMKIRYRRHPLIFWDGWWEIGKIGSVSSLKDWKVPNGSLYSTITSTRATWGQFSPTRNWFA